MAWYGMPMTSYTFGVPNGTPSIFEAVLPALGQLQMGRMSQPSNPASSSHVGAMRSTHQLHHVQGGSRTVAPWKWRKKQKCTWMIACLISLLWFATDVLEIVTVSVQDMFYILYSTWLITYSIIILEKTSHIIYHGSRIFMHGMAWHMFTCLPAIPLLNVQPRLSQKSTM